MRTALLVPALALALATAAHADSLTITSVTEMGEPAGINVVSKASQGFVGPKTVVFSAFGKACKWVGSGSVPAPQGCNYSITLNNTRLTFTDPGSNGGTCTPASQMLAACH